MVGADRIDVRGERMAEVCVRRAEAGDAEAVAGLLTELGRTALTDETRAPFHRVYLRRLDREDVADLVAESPRRVVGFCSLEFRQRLNRLRPEAWIPDLVVTAGLRRTGVGSALLARAAAAAREHGCWILVLESGHQRAEAHRFYHAFGMTDSALHFQLSLGPGHPSLGLGAGSDPSAR